VKEKGHSGGTFSAGSEGKMEKKRIIDKRETFNLYEMVLITSMK